NNEPTLSGKQLIGLIYPPPEIRTIVDKTANFVARNGVDFENKIREKESGNVRFNFLLPTDPYNAYYKHKVRELQEGKQIDAAPRTALPQAVKEAIKKSEFIPTKPPQPFEFSADPTTINAFDLDLIKLTAMFVARNGRPFLTQLMNREMRNFQFDFLKPQHSNFAYFTKLVEQYTKVAIPAKSIVNDLEQERTNRTKQLEDIKYRVAWEKHQKGLKEKEAAEAEKERVAYAQIDWHDFVVVQTVDFQPGDIASLPGLCTPKDVGARVLLEAREAEKIKESMQAAATEDMDMENSDEEGEKEDKGEERRPSGTGARAAHEVTQPAPLPPTKQGNLVIRDFDPKKAQAAKRGANEKWLVSPLTGEWVPSDKLEEHVRYNTMDSQYKEDREKRQAEKSSEEPLYAQGADVGKNLQNFAKRRTDIFGVGEAGAKQTQIGQMMGEDDGRGGGGPSSGTRDAPPSSIPVPPPSSMPPPSLPPRIPPPGSSGIRPPLPSSTSSAPAAGLFDGPANKKPRMTEDDLTPESEWLAKVAESVNVVVQLPISEEYNLNGQLENFKVQSAQPVSTLKDMLQDKYGIQVAKQKLKFNDMFMKDTSTFAFYNASNMSLIQLAIKERGGKK
ncbi:hypothetical protein PFISCL1PPCAC_5759, partial [Pristionchus fissidentatus]